jgi:response regulator of citrate/malate metabolism
MGKRKYVLDPLAMFQRKLEDYFKVKEIQMQQQQQASQAYLDTVYHFHLKGLSLREIEKVTGIPKATVHQWIQKQKKAKAQEQPQHA